NVTGSTTPSLIVGNSGSTSLFPIDSTGTVGTAITLPSAPNSIVYANTALGAYIGTGTSLLAYDATKNAIGTVTNVAGTVIGVSNNGALVVVFNNATGQISVISNSGTSVATIDQFTVQGVPNPCQTTDQCPQASFTPDSQSAYIVAGQTLYV